MKKIVIASDHAGLHLKKHIQAYLTSHYKQVEVTDVGTYEESSCHYPDYALKLTQTIKPADRGIVVCGSGIGIGIAVNKAGITCSTAINEYTAQ